jgi:hypothetical protein
LGKLCGIGMPSCPPTYRLNGRSLIQ